MLKKTLETCLFFPPNTTWSVHISLMLLSEDKLLLEKQTKLVLGQQSPWPTNHILICCFCFSLGIFLRYFCLVSTLTDHLWYLCIMMYIWHIYNAVCKYLFCLFCFVFVQVNFPIVIPLRSERETKQKLKSNLLYAWMLGWLLTY